MLAETPPTFTSLTKALWRCPHGHEWRATYGNIKKGQNCPYCSGHFKKSLADYHALANARGFAFVDELPSYAHNKALWRCPVGHEWLGTYVTISQGHGCPTCGYEAAAAKTRKEDTHKRIVARHLRNRRQKAVNTMTPELWEDALRYFNGCCAVCGRPPGLWHKLVGDHWIPLNDPLCPGTIPTNIVPLCHGAQGCNSSKRASDAKEWLTRKFGKRRAADILARIEAYFEHVKQPTP